MKSIKISGLDYTVNFRNNEEMGGLIGSADFNKQEININSTHTAQTKQIAIFHEILHLLSDSYGIHLTEEEVKIITHSFVALLRDNPNLVNDIFSVE
jgi:Zn-dependent peptidase ImmA (M78 family)